MRSKVFSFRLPLEDAAKLERMAESTHRTCADVLRLLVHRSELTGQADVRVQPLAGEAGDDRLAA